MQILLVNELQGTNGSQLWDTALAVQALLEVQCIAAVMYLMSVGSCVVS